MAKSDILKKIKAIKSSENIGDFFKKRYAAITDVAKGQRTLADEVSRIYGIASEIEEGTGLDWNAIYSGLAYIAKTRPNLMGRVAEAFNAALKSDKNNSNSIREAYEALESVIEKQPNLSEQVIDIVKVGMQSDKNNVYSSRRAYSILTSVIEKRSDLAEKAMDIFEFGISSEKQKSAGYYGIPTDNLSSIIKSRPELTDRVLNILENELNAGTFHVSSFYGVLEDALSARPEISDRIFQVFKSVLQSDRDGKRSSYHYATPILENVEQKYPNLGPQVIDAYKTILQLGGINEYLLESIYGHLKTLVGQQPDLAKQALETIEVGMKLSKDSSSLHYAFDSLKDIIHNRSDLWEQAVGICETVAGLDYVDSNANKSCQKEVCSILGNLITSLHSSVNKKQPELDLIERIFQAFEKMGQATRQEADGRSVALPRALQEIVWRYPSLAGRALDVLKKIPPSFVCSESSYFRFFDSIVEHPELFDQVVDIIKEGCQQNAINKIPDFKDNEIFYTLSDIVQRRPDLAEQVLDVYEISTQSDGGALIFVERSRNLLGAIGAQSKSARRIWDILEKLLPSKISYLISSISPHILFDTIGDIVKNNPDLAERVFKILNNELMLKNDSDSLSHSALYECLENVVAAKPDLAEQTFDLFVNRALQSSSSYAKGCVYEMLGCIVEVRPDLVNRVFQVIENELQSGKNIPTDYNNIFKTLAKIAQKQPQFADRVFKNFDKVLDSIDEPSMDYVSRCLSEVVQEQPKLAEQVFDTFQKGFQVYKKQVYKKNHPKNDRPVSGLVYVGVNHFLLRGYDVLRGVVNAQPDLTEQSFDTIKEMLKSDDNSSTCLTCAYNTLVDFVNAKPELAEQIFEITAEGKESPEQIYVYKACMSKRDVLKRLPPMEGIISKYPTIKQDLLVAYNGRQLEDDVFRHAAGLIDRRLLLETDILKNQPSAMKTLEKAFEQENADVKENSVRDFLIPTSLKFAAFPKKGYVADYIKRILTHNKRNPENKLTLHDAMYWLPDPMDKEASEHFMNFISKEGNLFYANDTTEGKEVHRPLEELTMIAQNWKSIENQMRDLNKDITKLSYAKILDICKSNKYKDQRNMSFAVEAATHGVPEKKYHQCEDIYLAGLKVPEPFDSKKTFKEGKYVGRFLPRDDARTLFFGAYTDCCQHFDGAGGACAISTVKDPFSQLFVIEDTERKNKIVAGSWVWENTEGNYREVCFDNIEIKEPSRENLSEDMKDRREKIISIYNQVGKYLTEEANCHRVTAGTGYDDAKVRDYYKETECIALPTLYKDGYSDAKEKQVLLAENSNATPLDKNKESQRYIRNVCYLDEEAMQNVSRKSFPEGDQELQNPENMDGFVVEDYDKGVVGYCLYDRGKKSIYDMAVLPEYRTDGNPSSSTKLFREMMEVIRKDGGKWTAEMRDETTLRFLKLMAKKGLVKYKEFGVDHEMSDGSKVIKVEFEPVKGTRDAIRSLQEQPEDKGKDDAKDAKIGAILSGGPTH